MSDRSVWTFAQLSHALAGRLKEKKHYAKVGGRDRKEELLQLEHSLQDEQQPEK